MFLFCKNGCNIRHRLMLTEPLTKAKWECNAPPTPLQRLYNAVRVHLD
jgi:hypothetical protein